MPDFRDMLNSEQAARLMKDQGKLDQLQNAPETQRLFQMLSKNAGGDLEQAAQQAAHGDTGRLTQDPEGQRLIQRLRQSLD